MMDNLFKEFENKKFQALPYEKKKEIVGQWADIRFADEDAYKNGDAKLKAKVKHNLASKVIDFKVRDFLPKVIDTFSGGGSYTPQAKDLNAPDKNYVDLTPDDLKNDFNKTPQTIEEAAKSQESADRAFEERKNKEAFVTQDKPLEPETLYFAAPVAGTARALQGSLAKSVAMNEAERIAADKMIASGQAFAESDIVGNAVGTTATSAVDSAMSDDFKKSHPNLSAIIELSAGLAGGGYAGYKSSEAILKRHKVLLDDVKAGKVSADVAEKVLQNDKDVQQVKKEVGTNDIKEPVLTPDAKETTDEFLNRTAHPTVSEELGINDSVIPQELPKVDEALQKDEEGWNKLFEEQNGAKPKEEPQATQEPIQKKELPLQQQLQKAQSDKAQSLRKAEFEKSVNNVAGADAHYADAQKYDENIQDLKTRIDEKNKPIQEKVQELTQHPRYKELLDMRRDISAKDSQFTQKLVNKREILHDNNGNGYETKVIPAQYERNYAYDFALTKNDVKKLENGKADENTLAKLETDLGTLDNHPDYAPTKKLDDTDVKMSDKDWEEANALFANGGKHLAIGVLNGTSEAYNTDGTLEDKQKAFIKGLFAGAIGSKISVTALKKISPKLYDKASLLFQDEVKHGKVGMFVGSKPNEMGTFSDVASKKAMREIDDSKAELKATPKELQKVKDIKNSKDLKDIIEQWKSGELTKPESIKLYRAKEHEVLKTNIGTHKLGDVLEHKELFSKYPELTDTKVSFRGMPKKSQGYFDKKNNEIVLNKNMPQEQIKSTLLHEVQHHIQDKDGFATGGSAEAIDKAIQDKKRVIDSINKMDKNFGFSKWVDDNNIIEKYKLKGNGKINPDDFDEMSYEFAKTLPSSKQIAYINALKNKQTLVKVTDGMKATEDGFHVYKRLLGEQQARATQYRANMTPQEKASETWQDTLKRVEGEYKEPIVKFDDGGVSEQAINIGKNSDTSLDDVNSVLDNHSKKYIHKSLSDTAWKKEFNLKNVTDTAKITDVNGNNVNITYAQMKKMVSKARGHYLGLIKPTLQDPTIILKHDDAEVYISRFYDEKKKKYNLFAVSKDYNTGELTLSSIVQRRDSQIRNKILEGEVTYMKDHGSVDGTSSSRVTSPDQSTGSHETIIPQKERNQNDIVHIAKEDTTNEATKSHSSSKIVENGEKFQPHEIYGEDLKGEPTVSNAKDGTFSSPETSDKTIIQQKDKNIKANGLHSMAGGFAGGADSIINQRDYNGDGKYDAQDLLEAVAAGAISINVAKKIAPKLFEEEASKGVKIGAFAGNKSEKKILKESGVSDVASLPEETKIQLFQRKVQDKFNRVAQLINHKANMETIDDALNPYQKEEVYHGKVEQRLTDFELKTVTPIFEKISRGKLSLDEVDKYLWARHAPERNKRILELNGKENGSGMSDEDAYKIIDKYKDNKAMNEIVNDVYTMNKDRLKTIKQDGLESDEFIGSLDKLYKNYIPLRREFKDKELSNINAVSKGFSIAGKEIKRAKGSDRTVESPLIHSILAYESTIIRSEKNEVGKSFLAFTEKFPDDSLYSVEKVGSKTHFNKESGAVEAQDHVPEENIMQVKRDGEIYNIKIKDKALASAFKNLNASQQNGLMSFAHKGIRFLAALNTMYNPEFVVSNFERDIQTAMINLPDGMKANRLEILKDVAPAMKGIYKAIKNPNVDDEWGKLFIEMRKNGGTTGWSQLHDVDSIKGNIKNLSDEYNGKIMPTQKFKKVLKYIDDINDAVENSTRLVAYKMAKKSGYSIEKSASIAKNLTVNFNRKGENGTGLNTFYMFFNASVQGSARMTKALVKSKKAQGIVTGIGLGAIGLDYYNRSVNADAYEVIPQYIKDTNYIIMNADGSYEHFQLPYGYNVFKGVGDMVSAVAHNELKMEDIPKRLLSLGVNAFSPVGVDDSSLLHTIIPTLGKPIYEVEFNKNFFGGNIRPEDNPYSQGLPDSQKYFKSVNPFAKSIAQTVNEFTGGTMHKSGAIDVSPETLEYLASVATGGLGHLLVNTATVIDQAFSKDEKVDINKVPFLRKVYAVPRKKEQLQHVYEMFKTSGKQQYTPLERRRYFKWLKTAHDKGDVVGKQYKKLTQTFNKNQRLLDYETKYNIQKKDDFTNNPDAQRGADEFMLTRSQRKHYMEQ